MYLWFDFVDVYLKYLQCTDAISYWNSRISDEGKLLTLDSTVFWIFCSWHCYADSLQYVVLQLNIFTGTPAQSTAMPVLFLLGSPKMGFLPPAHPC